MREETGLPVVAAQDDVRCLTGEVDAGAAGHAGTLASKVSLAPFLPFLRRVIGYFLDPIRKTVSGELTYGTLM